MKKGTAVLHEEVRGGREVCGHGEGGVTVKQQGGEVGRGHEFKYRGQPSRAMNSVQKR